MTSGVQLCSNMLTSSTSFATGWYVVANSSGLKIKPRNVQLFGEDWVLWRDSNRRPVLMQAHCCHNGANLSGGRVIKDCIECPFHGWQFNAQGRCTIAPGVETIPQTARQYTFPVEERYGFIWAWYGTPEPLFALPEFPPFDVIQEKFLPIRFSFRAKTSVRRIIENFYDGQHTVTLHKLPATAVTIAFDAINNQKYGGCISANIKQYVGLAGAVASLFGMNFSKFDFKVTSTATMHSVKAYLDDKFRFTSIVAVTPVATGETIQRVLILVKRGNNPLDTALLYAMFAVQSYFTGKQDVPIWNGIKESVKGVYVKNDKAVLEFRKFYQNWVELKN